MIFSWIVTISSLLYVVEGAAIRSRSQSGRATFYTGNVSGGTCSFSNYSLPPGLYGTALALPNWDNAAHCGQCVIVTGPNGNQVNAMIVDQCPDADCQLNHLDLFPNAFAALADPVKGIIDITWDYTDCPIASPLKLHLKDGASQYYFSIQVVNANRAISKLEVSTDGGANWQGTTRQPYNFFQTSGGVGSAPVTVRVTSTNGDVVVVHGVTVSSGASITASKNFG